MVPTRVHALPRRQVARQAVSLSPLLASTLPRIDATDAWTTPCLAGDPEDVRGWHSSIFSAAPLWVRRLMALRDVLVRPLGLGSTSGSPARRGFPEISADEAEIVTGVDDRHLSFRVSTRKDEDTVTVTTIVQVHNRLGRLYWAVVRWFHPVVVRSLLQRAAPGGGRSSRSPAPEGPRPVRESRQGARQDARRR